MQKRISSSLAVLMLLAGCSGKPTEDNYAKVKAGMTMSEVESILGKADNSMDSPLGSVKSWDVAGTQKKIMVTFKDGKSETKDME